ncbi:hypothetical protein Patl1_05120 [Pistacia atlantica]|uniref:Uncharacterized protein n=1 Tax=Pistacia atlantica TaxID=434234 RepID=A0ACC1BT20_9ROSI|nr:hypothetical protein Patl1_05120 [Pistacia atlantica]
MGALIKISVQGQVRMFQDHL